MRIGIIGGTGALGKGLASRMIKTGFEVFIGSRKQDSAVSAALSLGLKEENGGLNYDIASKCDLGIITVPFSSQTETLEGLIEPLKNKILIDATVPLIPPKVMRVQLPKEGCAALKAQMILDESTQVVSAFQNISAELLQSDAMIDCDVLVCGDKKAAREEVISLINKIGLTGWHAGPLCNSAAAEALTSILIAINKNHEIKHSGIKITGV